MDLSSIYTELIAEHSKSQHNKRHLANPTAVLKGRNPSCGDEITLEVVLKDGVIEEAAFTGIGCAISQASTSIMIDLVQGQTVEQAQILIDTFLGMIKREIKDDADLEILEEASALKNISNMPARVKCAVLSWHTLESVIKGEKDN
jgi:nitrogen fixation NifU-like protein